MVRRSFRLGWRLGAIVGLLLAVAKVVQSRRSSRDDAWAPARGADAWPPVQAEPVAVEPPATTVAERMPPVLRAPGSAPADATPPMAPAPPAAPDAPVAPAPPITPAAPVAPAPPVVPAPVPPPGAPAARPAKRPAKKAGTRRVRVRTTWVEAMDSECPASHPVKAKLSSMLYHLPGMAAYNRTRPDRCYTEATAAEADGFTRAKR